MLQDVGVFSFSGYSCLRAIQSPLDLALTIGLVQRQSQSNSLRLVFLVYFVSRTSVSKLVCIRTLGLLMA